MSKDLIKIANVAIVKVYGAAFYVDYDHDDKFGAWLNEIVENAPATVERNAALKHYERQLDAAIVQVQKLRKPSVLPGFILAVGVTLLTVYAFDYVADWLSRL